jgi:membrane protease YdiL (CAAX protease family)
MNALDYRAMSANRQLNFTGAAAIWAALGLFGAFFGTWLGYGGRRFAFALAVCAVLLAGMLFPAAANVREKLLAWFGKRSAWITPLIPVVAIVIYAAGANGFDWKAMVFGAGYALLPAALLFSAGEKPPGQWQDYAAALAIWLPVELRWLYRLWPYPPQLTHTMTILFAVNVALAAFLLLRRLDGIGYTIEWGPGFSFAVAFSFIVFAVIAIPLGEGIGFIHFDPSMARLRSLPLAALGILFFTAWPEELLFRGLLQNLLARTLRSPTAGLFAASVVFGFAHINNGPFPNWRYVLLATIAGIFYGRAWMKTGSIFASCLVHALVDITWHTLFR